MDLILAYELSFAELSTKFIQIMNENFRKTKENEKPTFICLGGNLQK